MTRERERKQDGDRAPRPRGRWRLLLAVAGVLAAFAVGMCVGGGPSGSEPGHGEHAPGTEEVWTCVMHLEIRSSKPGKCPICGMELVRADSVGGAEAADPGMVTLSERAKVLAEIRTAPVVPLVASARSTRLLGRVDYDETRVKTVTAWTGGRLDRLLVATTGQRIRPGQAIARIYSPEIYTAHSDLIQARKQTVRLADGSEPARAAAQAALEAARNRLRLLGVPDADLAAMETAEAPARLVTIRAPVGGTVIARLVDEGNYVTTGAALYRVADLGRLWLQLDAYEADAPLLSVGSEVEFEVSSLPGRVFRGVVAFIDPVVDPRKRVIRVRVEVANASGELRPGMFAEAILRTAVTPGARGGSSGGADAGDTAAPGLMIPASAPLFTGRRSIVYVEVPGADRPSYRAREVELGPRAGDYYPVLAGLALGERVVVQGAFVLDADLQIAGGASMMTRLDDPARAGQPVALSAVVAAQLSAVVAAYLAAQEALARDDVAGAAAAGAAIEREVAVASARLPQRLRTRWDPLAVEIVGYAAHLARAADMPPNRDGARDGDRDGASESSDAANALDVRAQHARHALEGLTAQMFALLGTFGNPGDEALYPAFCPMASGGRGAPWLQRGADIRNPYMGQRMPGCGDIGEPVAPGAVLDPRQAPGRKPSRQSASTSHDHGR